MSSDNSYNHLTFRALRSRSLTFSSAFLQVAKRAVYPSTCLSCHAMTSDRMGLCVSCWNEVQFIEKPICEITGRPFSHDLGEGIVSADAIANPPPYRRARAALVYQGAARKMLHRLKYKDRAELAKFMALWMVRAGRDCLDDADCIIPVPLHLWRIMGRKYNQSAELARAIAAFEKIEYLPGVLFRNRSTRPQVGLAATAREKNVRGAFRVPEDKRSEILGRHVLLIDDVLTTGATVNAASRALKSAGANDVSVLTFARVEAGM